ncbi:MAG: hypothetical protein QM649_03860 [Silvibacterium sp.]
MFDFLCSCDKPGIAHGPGVRLFGDIFAGGNDRREDRILLVVHIVVINFSDQIFQTRDVNFCFFEMGFESLLQLSVACMLNHLGKTFDDLLFCGQQVTQLGKVKRPKILEVVGCDKSHGFHLK